MFTEKRSDCTMCIRAYAYSAIHLLIMRDSEATVVIVRSEFTACEIEVKVQVISASIWTSLALVSPGN